MIEEALQHYNFMNPHVQLNRHNENMTYLIDDEEKKYVLRIHKSVEGHGFREEDLADLNWTLHNKKLSLYLYAGYESIYNQKIDQSFINMYTVLYPISYISSHHKKSFQNQQFKDAVKNWLGTMIEPFVRV